MNRVLALCTMMFACSCSSEPETCAEKSMDAYHECMMHNIGSDSGCTLMAEALLNECRAANTPPPPVSDRDRFH